MAHLRGRLNRTPNHSFSLNWRWGAASFPKTVRPNLYSLVSLDLYRTLYTYCSACQWFPSSILFLSAGVVWRSFNHFIDFFMTCLVPRLIDWDEESEVLLRRQHLPGVQAVLQLRRALATKVLSLPPIPSNTCKLFNISYDRCARLSFRKISQSD